MYDTHVQKLAKIPKTLTANENTYSVLAKFTVFYSEIVSRALSVEKNQLL